jgi:lipopolysaccharide biosynthesis glycosyltransferase
MSNYLSHPKILVYYSGSNREIRNLIRCLENFELKDIFYRDNFKGQTKRLGPVNHPGVYLKYNLWTSDFSDYDNVLYLDCDTLVQKSLDYLFDEDEFFIVSNHEPHTKVRVFGKDKRDNWFLQRKLNKYGIEYPEGQNSMANAGVFLIPKKYRTYFYYTLLCKLSKSFIKYSAYADQSIISLWCSILNIPIRPEYLFNYQPSFGSLRDIGSPPESARIIHFSGPYSPDSEEFLNWDWAGPNAKYFNEVYLKYQEVYKELLKKYSISV